MLPEKLLKQARATGSRRGLRTHARLIETAGQVFAAQGVDRATGQEICRRARVHSAAIVYHFGGMQGLYRAVFQEACRRLVSTEALAAAVAAERDPRRKLAAFLGLIVAAVASPMSASWAARLFSREFVAPSVIYGQVHDRLLAGRAKILKSIVSALTALPPNDAVVARACVSIMAPCAVLLLFHRHKLARLLPQIDLSPAAAPQITRQLVRFALGGLGAVARPAARTRLP